MSGNTSRRSARAARSFESTLELPLSRSAPAIPLAHLAAEVRSARLTVLATSFGLGMALLDVTAVNVAVPSIQASLQTDVRGLSWVIDGYALLSSDHILLVGPPVPQTLCTSSPRTRLR